MRLINATLVVIGIGLSAPSFAEDMTMDPDRPVQCARDKQGQLWRLQCNEVTKVCLYAANDELDADGNRIKPLEQARDCSTEGAFDRAKLEASGFTMLPGRPDTPYGWMRDERGRVFQVNFDLKRRLYFGAGYTPRKVLENPFESKRTSIDFGLFVMEFLDEGRTPTRHRIRLMEGQVHVEPFSAEVTVAHYDMSRRFFNPLLRITTFAGTPQRHDL